MYKILFVCTGNFYRSRFCEYYMEYLGDLLKLPLSCSSKGFAIDLADHVVTVHGEISPFTTERLKLHGIEVASVKPREYLYQDDIDKSDIVIIIDKNEHSQYLSEFNFLKKNTIFWEVKDIADWSPNETLSHLESNCQKLSYKIWEEYHGQ